MNIFRWITDRIFGFDVFISYSREDGQAYARKLEEDLLRTRLRCFLDSKEMPPGSALKLSLRSALARSTALVLVASPGSLKSPYMPVEFDNYTESRKHRPRRIIPISIGRTLDDAPRDLPIIKRLRDRADVIWISELPDRLPTGPSKGTMGSLLASFRFTRRNAIRDTIVSSACVLLAVLLLIAVWMGINAERQRRVAVTERNVAQRALSEANYRLAADASKDDRDGDALAYLAQALETDPANEVAECRLLSLLIYREWPVEEFELNHGVPLVSGEFSPDGFMILTAGSDGTAKLWDATDGKLLHTMAQGEPIRQAGFSPDGSRVVTSGGRTVHFWDAAGGVEIGAGITEDYSIMEFAFEPAGKRVAVACEGPPAVAKSPDDNPEDAPPPPGYVSIVNIATGKAGGPNLHEGKGVTKLAWRPGDVCLALGNGATIEVWDVNTNRARYPAMQFGGMFFPTLTALKFGGRGKWLLAAGGANSDGAVAEDGIASIGYTRIWDASDGRPLNRAPVFDTSAPRTLSDNSWMRDVAMDETASDSSDFGAIFTGADSGKIAGWDNAAEEGDTPNFQLEDSLSERLDLPVERLVLDDAGSLLAIANDRATGVGYVRQWGYGTTEGGSAQPISERMEHQGMVPDAAWSPDGRRIVTVGDDGIARVWWTGQARAEGEFAASQKKPKAQMEDDATESGTPTDDDNDPSVQKMVKNGTYTDRDLWANRIAIANIALSEDAPIPAALTAELAKVVTAPNANRTRFLVISGARSYRAFRSPDAHWLVTSECGDQQSSAKGEVWDLSNGKNVGTFSLELPIQDMAFADDAGEFAVASGYFTAGKVRVFNTRAVRLLAPAFEGPGKPIVLCFAPGGMRLAVGFGGDSMENGNNLGVYDVQTGLPLVDPRLSGPANDAISFSSDGQRIVVGQHRGNISYDVPSPAAPAPDWLPELARIVSHREIDDSNSVRRIRHIASRTDALKQKLNSAPPSTAKTVAQWFFANPVDRSVAPLATLTRRQELEGAIHDWAEDADKLVQKGTSGSDSDPDPIASLQKGRSLESESFGDPALLDSIVLTEKRFQSAGIQILSRTVAAAVKENAQRDASTLKARLRKFRALTTINPALTRDIESLQDSMDKSFPIKAGSLPAENAKPSEE